MFLKAWSSFEQVYTESTWEHTCKYVHILQESEHDKCKIDYDSHYIYLTDIHVLYICIN